MKRLLARCVRRVVVAPKGQRAASWEFAARIAEGPLREMAGLEEQLAALPAELAAVCRQAVADGDELACTRRQLVVTQFAVWRIGAVGELLAEWEGSTELAAVRLKREENAKEQTECLKLLFRVGAEERPAVGEPRAWLGDSVVGQMVAVELTAGPRPIAESGEEDGAEQQD